MTEYTKKLFSEEVSKDIRVIGFKVISNVVNATPVDTGRARGNWQIGIDAVKTNVIEALDKSGGNTINNATSELFKVDNFETIWITNNLFYIGELNNGTSLQAPAKFVESGIVRALNV